MISALTALRPTFVPIVSQLNRTKIFAAFSLIHILSNADVIPKSTRISHLPYACYKYRPAYLSLCSLLVIVLAGRSGTISLYLLVSCLLQAGVRMTLNKHVLSVGTAIGVTRATQL
jgi:hypothetical protein